MSEEVIPAAQDTREVQRPRRVLRRRPWMSSLLLLVLLAVAWELLKLLFGIPDQKLPHLSAIVATFLDRPRGDDGPLRAALLLGSAATTLGEAFMGFVLGALLGCGLAMIFASSRLLERGLLPYVVGSQTVPILAIAPMVVVGLGQLNAPDWLAKAVVAAYLTFFPVTIGMLRGLRSTPPDALDLMRSYAATPAQVFLKLRLPAALPYLFTSLKVAATACVIGALVAELPAGSTNGIGVEIIKAAQFYNARPPLLFATVLMAAAIGLVFYGGVALAEKVVVRERKAE
ncbi:MAG TPA: ABC transporter permease [Roseiflexaceae bacterium]|nr:ABC transporter permease [Roseiflexaceae bacterium]